MLVKRLTLVPAMLPKHAPVVWHRPGKVPNPGKLDIHLWAARLDDYTNQNLLDYYHGLLSDREKGRLNRLRVELPRKRYVISRGILRRLLQHYCDQPAASLRFQFGPKGKPSLESKAGEALSFNNTDSAGLAIYAFARDRELGVDLERIPRKVRAQRISRRRFAEVEAQRILSQPRDRIDDTFLSCWTRKEAWGKAIGTGIHYPMREVILCDQMSSAIVDIDDGDRQWRLMQFNVDEKSTACLVAENTDWRVQAFTYQHDWAR